jgi:outer membrane protein OmpA-like peptidoglycan-associated protein
MNKISVLTILIVLLGSAMIHFHTAFAQEMSQGQGTKGESRQILPVAPGQKLKIKGVIVKRGADSFTLRDQLGSDLTVNLTTTTKVEEKKKNPFRGAKTYNTDQLIRSLIVEVEGHGDGSSALIADKIRFSEDDLNVARAVDSQVSPVESRLGEAENRLSQTEQNAQRLSGQIEEMTEVANVARGGARAAQETADAAMAGVNRTNERISALDEYEIGKSVTVQFKVGSARLLPEAMTQLDEIATQAKTEKGFVIEVRGFASADGSEEFNRRLSQRRAEAVIRYLAEKHDIPLRRMILSLVFGVGNDCC